MEASVIVAIAAAGIAALGVGVTIVVLLVRGGYQLGRNTALIESLAGSVEEVKEEIKQLRSESRRDIQELRAETRRDIQELRIEMNAGFEKLADAIDALRVEIQRTNQMVAALANHTHDTGGRTAFTVPSPPSG